jgi:multidrug efflux pump subunit AcrA (membrane-fusion protein)
VAYAVETGRIRPRPLVLGPSNQDFVVVDKGLSEGDRVCLRDPSSSPSDFGGTEAR